MSLVIRLLGVWSKFDGVEIEVVCGNEGEKGEKTN